MTLGAGSKNLTNLVELTYMMLYPIKAPGLEVSEEKSFKVFISKIYFSLCELDMQLTETN